jgi:hypothetical protein
MRAFLQWAGYSLEAVLLWRLVSWKVWRHFPVFFAYFLFLVARQGVVLQIESSYGSSSTTYSRWFWYTSILSDILKLLVAWEVFRKVFQPGSAARRFAGALLVATLAGLSLFYLLGGAHDTNFFVAVGLNFSFVVAVWMFAVLALAQYYHIPLGRNLWGIAVGLGLFSAMAVVNLSALGLDERVFPAFAYARPASFVLSVLIWVFCLWSYQPPAENPSPVRPPDSDGSNEPLQAASGALGRAVGLRKPEKPSSQKINCP